MLWKFKSSPAHQTLQEGCGLKTVAGWQHCVNPMHNSSSVLFPANTFGTGTCMRGALVSRVDSYPTSRGFDPLPRNQQIFRERPLETREKKEKLRRLKRIYHKGKLQLAEVWKSKEASKPKRNKSTRVDSIVRARKAGLFIDPQHELFAINKLLESDGLSSGERFSLNRRKKNILSRLTTREE